VKPQAPFIPYRHTAIFKAYISLRHQTKKGARLQRKDEQQISGTVIYPLQIKGKSTGNL
jgi:hypothetical protein